MSEPVTESNKTTGAPTPAPDFPTILAFAGVAPEVWLAMSDARRAEWLRAYEFQRQRAGVEGGETNG